MSTKHRSTSGGPSQLLAQVRRVGQEPVAQPGEAPAPPPSADFSASTKGEHQGIVAPAPRLPRATAYYSMFRAVETALAAFGTLQHGITKI